MLSSGNLFQLPVPVPGHHQEVADAPTEAVPDAVFGPPSGAWTVGHRQFFDGGASALSEDGHEPVKPVESRDFVQDRPFERPKVTASVAEIHTEHRPPGDARNYGRNAP